MLLFVFGYLQFECNINWAIGYYIVEYEQGGKDRAEYGTSLLKSLENKIAEKGISKKSELLIQPSEDNRNTAMITIKDSFTFEFLGLEAKEAVSELDLEQTLMEHLQEFVLKEMEDMGI